MPRFYVEIPLPAGESVALPDAIVRHVQVLRLRVGDMLTLFDGSGTEYPATLERLEKRAARVMLGQPLTVSRESPLWVGLAQSVSSAERMDLTLQKGVELGVSVFQPLVTRRSIVKLNDERAARRVARWQEIVIAACEQCGRNIVPEVRPIMAFADWLAQPLDDAQKLILSVGGDGGLAALDHPRRVWLMAGPEGGFEPLETEAAVQAGWQALTLGPRVLRTETAALAATAALQTLWGDFGGQAVSA